MRENYSLKAHNTFGVDVKAKYFATFDTLAALTDFLKRSPLAQTEKCYCLGQGSNILLTQDIQGLVLQLNFNDISVEKEDNQHIWLNADAGLIWHDFVRHCAHKGYGGVENLAYIPGLMGAAPIQNIGAYGMEVKDTIETVNTIEVKTGKMKYFSNAECEFAYRNSIFKQAEKGKYIITSVVFKLDKKPTPVTHYKDIAQYLAKNPIQNPTPRDICKLVTKIRQEKLPDPKKIPNAGSFFKNPVIALSTYQLLKKTHPDIPHFPVNAENVKLPAAWLIEKAGWKGKKIGNVATHHKQALVIVNHGNATGHEIVDFADKIQTDIKEKFDVFLEQEVTIFS